MIAPAANASECEPCDAGKYQDVVATTFCHLCAAGRYGDSTSLTACKECLPGYAATTPGLTACSACPAGSEPDAVIHQCRACAPGRYCPSTGGGCILCLDQVILFSTSSLI